MLDIVVVDDTPLNEQVDIHLLPVQISHTGSANVAKYFKITDTSTEGKTTLESSFRGRLLCGAVQHVPPTHVGVIFRENESEADNEEQNKKTWQISAKFEKFTYWLREEPPHENDMVQRWMQWISVADAVNGPVTAEMMAQPNKLVPTPKTPSHISKIISASPEEISRKRKRSSENTSPNKRLKQEDADEEMEEEKNESFEGEKEEKSPKPTLKVTPKTTPKKITKTATKSAQKPKRLSTTNKAPMAKRGRRKSK